MDTKGSEGKSVEEGLVVAKGSAGRVVAGGFVDTKGTKGRELAEVCVDTKGQWCTACTPQVERARAVRTSRWMTITQI